MSTPSNQFLSSLLSQRGPSAVPYTEDVKWLIRQHLISLSDSFPSLHSQTAAFTHNDGRSVNLLQAEGTIPISYNHNTYNIPVILWLLEPYPRHAPLVFVNPTRDMIIRRHHPFVNPSGVVNIPYLDNWIYPSSNLVELCRNLSHFFGRDPPLYSRPNPINYGSGPASGSVSGPGLGSGSGLIRPATPPGVYPGYGTGGGGGGNYGGEEREEVFRRNGMNKLVESLYSDMVSMRKGREGEMEGMMNVQGVLREREGELGRGVREMGEEKERVERELERVMSNGEALEGWLRENEKKVEVLKSVDVDDAFEHCDGLSKQMFECTASDLAMEDLIYALDKAVQEGAIPFDQYLRNVRMYSREQFIHRATASKVRAAQMQAQVSNMASRAPAYGL